MNLHTIVPLVTVALLSGCAATDSGLLNPHKKPPSPVEQFEKSTDRQIVEHELSTAIQNHEHSWNREIDRRNIGVEVLVNRQEITPVMDEKQVGVKFDFKIVETGKQKHQFGSGEYHIDSLSGEIYAAFIVSMAKMVEQKFGDTHELLFFLDFHGNTNNVPMGGGTRYAGEYGHVAIDASEIRINGQRPVNNVAISPNQVISDNETLGTLRAYSMFDLIKTYSQKHGVQRLMQRNRFEVNVSDTDDQDLRYAEVEIRIKARQKDAALASIGR